MRSSLILLLAGLECLTACGRAPDRTTIAATTSGAATRHTAAANAAVAGALPLGDLQDFEDAQRGFIATDVPLNVAGPDGTTAWDFENYAFVQGDAPSTVNPSLWRQAKLNGRPGLFEVVPGIHQVRGYDISNMTLIDVASVALSFS